MNIRNPNQPLSHSQESASPASGLGLQPAVVILEPDLFFRARLADVVTAQGGAAVVVESADAFVAAMDSYDPVLALVDLQTPDDWEAAIRRCKARPHTRSIPIYAFGSHVEVAVLQRARRAGVDHAWARSRMMEELVALVAEHIQPPVRHPEGWNAPLSPLAREGVELFNAGDYFEQHELLEEAWMAESRPIRELYQGILQVGVAFLQIERGNWRGAVKMFRRGLPRLRTLPEICQGLHIGEFLQSAEAVHQEISRLGPAGLPQFDRSLLPKIRFADSGPKAPG